MSEVVSWQVSTFLLLITRIHSSVVSPANPHTHQCIDCHKDISHLPIRTKRCEKCNHKHGLRNLSQWRKRRNKRKQRFCLGFNGHYCGKEITFRPNRAVRCEECSKEYNRLFRNEWRRNDRKKKAPSNRNCSRCGTDISNYHYLAEICTDCRKHNKQRVERDYYWSHKSEMNRKASIYYQANRESILKDEKMKRILKHLHDNVKRMQTDDRYPKDLFEKDLQTIRDMQISDEARVEKGNALAHLYYNQNKEWIVDPMAIGDMRENILKETQP